MKPAKSQLEKQVEIVQKNIAKCVIRRNEFTEEDDEANRLDIDFLNKQIQRLESQKASVQEKLQAYNDT